MLCDFRIPPGPSAYKRGGRHRGRFSTRPNFVTSGSATDPPTSIEEGLLQAREWAHHVQQPKKTVATLREASTAAQRERGEHHAKLRSVQDVLAVVIQRLEAL